MTQPARSVIAYRFYLLSRDADPPENACVDYFIHIVFFILFLYSIL